MIEITEPHRCPNCDSYSVVERQQMDEFLHGRELVRVLVPMMLCTGCGQQWTDYRAEDIREEAVRDRALGPRK